MKIHLKLKGYIYKLRRRYTKIEKRLDPGTTEVSGSSEDNDKIVLNFMNVVFYMQQSQEAVNSHFYMQSSCLFSALGRSGNMKRPISY